MTRVLRRLLLGALIAASPLTAGEPIAIRVSPRFAFAPGTVVIRTTVERDRGNRALQLEVDSDAYYRSSLVQLNGDDAPRTSTFELRDLPGGGYIVRATLLGPDGRPRNMVHEAFNILSR